MTNPKYINHSYDAVLIITKYNEKTPEFNVMLDKIRNKNEVLAELEFQMMIHYAWSMAYKDAMEDGYITAGEQMELNQIKRITNFYDLKSTNRVMFREYVTKQLKDLDFVQNFENKEVKPSLDRRVKYELPKPTPYNTGRKDDDKKKD